jgi:hypothetical protein
MRDRGLRSPTPHYGEEWCQMEGVTQPRQAELAVRQLGVSEAGTPEATRDRISRLL